MAERIDRPFHVARRKDHRTGRIDPPDRADDGSRPSATRGLDEDRICHAVTLDHYQEFTLRSAQCAVSSGRNRAYLMPSRMKKIVLTFLALFLLPIAVRAVLVSFETRAHSWHEADWSSIGSLPPATSHPAARVLFLSARTGRWKGIFATHSWIVLKRENAYLEPPRRRGRLGQLVRTNGWAPDGRWFGDSPVVVADVNGAEATVLLPKIEAAIKAYQFAKAGDYRVWPGPNSNTFVAAVLRAVPELSTALPPTAIGKRFSLASVRWPERQPHRRGGKSLGRARREDRLGRGESNSTSSDSSPAPICVTLRSSCRALAGSVGSGATALAASSAPIRSAHPLEARSQYALRIKEY